MAVSGDTLTPSGSYRLTGGILRHPPLSAGTLNAEFGKSIFYSKRGAVPRLCSSSSSSDSELDMEGNKNERLTDKRTPVISWRFPKLQECAHFHYDRVQLDNVLVSMYEGITPAVPYSINVLHDHYHGVEDDGRDYFVTLCVSSNGKSWLVRRTYRHLCKFDVRLHKCAVDRKFSQLPLLPKLHVDSIRPENLQLVKADLAVYLARFSQLAGNAITCAPILQTLELDNRGNRLFALDDSAINTPAVAACKVVKRYVEQAADELTLEVGDMISVIDCPPCEESMWWRGKKDYSVGFFPSDCVELIGGGLVSVRPGDTSVPTPALRKRGKLVTFFRSFLSTRPSRRRLKESGILRERVYGCDLGEHLLNTNQDIPSVLVHCANYIEEHGTIDGIYRLSGISSNIQKLRLEFDAEKVPDLLDDVYVQDIHSVASVLKLYFRELPNPLLTYQLYHQFVQAVQASEEMRLLKIHHVVTQLPPPHFRTLEFLMRHLARIASSADKTGMHSKNLAIVWAPNLLRSSESESGVEALRGVGVCAVAVEYLIKYADLIFSNRLQSSSLWTRSSGAGAKHGNRPKSVAVSTPTKLLSLDQARALTRPSFDQTFIEVGDGPENIPKYHTVIDVSSRKKRRNREKSPSTWRNLFISKNRKQSWPFRSPLSLNDHDLAPSHDDSSSKPVGVCPAGSSAKRRKLRLAHSAESLSSSRSLKRDFSRHVNLTEGPIPPHSDAIFRQCPAAASVRSRSLSHNSYFDHPAETRLAQPQARAHTVIDVIRTVPCSMTEGGVLVKLSFDESPHKPVDKTQPCDHIELTPEKRRTGRFSFNRARGKPAKVSSVNYLVPVQVHRCKDEIRRGSSHRTLSPQFLRKHRPPSSGVKRSLSASPCRTALSMAGHDGYPTTASSSPSMIPPRKASPSASGRKSFRRSTSDDHLILPAVSSHSLISATNLPESLPMDCPEEETRTSFESTEMELFDEICAEIYGHNETDYAQVVPDVCGAAGSASLSAPGKCASLQDVGEICQEVERPVTVCADTAPSLSLPVSSSYYYNGDTRSASTFVSPSNEESLHPNRTLSVSLPSTVSLLSSSSTYYFGQVLSSHGNEASNLDHVKDDLNRLKANYFGFLPSIGSKNTGPVCQEDDEVTLGTDGKRADVASSQCQENGQEVAAVLLTDAPFYNEGSKDASANDVICNVRVSAHISQDLPGADLFKCGQVNGLTTTILSTNLADDLPGDKDLHLLETNSAPLIVEAKEEYSVQTSLSFHHSDAKVLSAAWLCSDTVGHHLEELGVLEKERIVKEEPVCLDPCLAVESGTVQESPPSVRQLRHHFESSVGMDGLASFETGIGSDTSVTSTTLLRSETLKEKLHALSDRYREVTAPSFLPLHRENKHAITFSETASSNDVVCPSTKMLSPSPVLPEKPRHLRSAGTVSGPRLLAPLMSRRDSADKSIGGSMTSLCSVSSAGGAPASLLSQSLATELPTLRSTKVSQMRQMYETSSPTIVQPERSAKKVTGSVTRPPATTFFGTRKV